MNLEPKPGPLTKGISLARLSLLLLVSVLGIAAFWHVAYDVSLVNALVVVAEISVLLAVAFVCAWRWSR